MSGIHTQVGQFERIGPQIKKLFLYAVLVGLGLSAWGFYFEPRLLRERREEITKWPGPGLTIAFFSDLHAGSPYIDEKYIGDLVRRINAHNPDLVLIGGDLMINGILGGRKISRDVIATMLGSLKAKLGVFAVLGNHDWWNEDGAIRASLQENGIRVLENEAQYFALTPQFHFWLVGLGDSFTLHTDYPAAVDRIKTDAPRILFMHDPAALFEVKDKFFLALAGHMHGGQVFVPGIGALITPGKAPKEWAQGWIQTAVGSLFVSKGIGTSILPVRLNAPPEFVILRVTP